ncbi:AMP-dependent synthetase/ligase [Mycolicibacterium phocaicum]|uniref:AMP-dependent synthetase/ligase n=1 Tax=Mycolicibacterium phocaicum TaxID=319706 RepID=UPI00092C8F27|nr:long-chain fatty acid--CoA ligase [Mycolicibacterium phocaicum]UCZ62487.1 long-chain fatty acid--CoA ligase [Mycolicibacterium phocaicum]SHT67842.1 fatty-acid--CoA ligase [Mycobacteroides abscessus subsp. abscessus]
MTSPPTTAARTMCDVFQQTIARNPQATAIRTVGDGCTLSFAEWGAQAADIAAGLAGIGVRRGDSVALLMTNRPEFYPIDVAVQHLGAVPFSIYNTSSPEQMAYLLGDSGARVVVCEEQYVPSLMAARLDKTVPLVCIDGKPDGTLTLDEVIGLGDPNFDFEKTWRAVQPDDVMTLIYTSGTTGDPKGVQVTHANMVAMVAGAVQLWQSTAEDRIVSFLPSAHIADRLSGLYHLMAVGNQLTTVADRKELAAALLDVRPTIFGAVPQVWQKLKAAIEARLDENDGAKKVLASWALDIGRQVSDRELEGRSVPLLLGIQHRAADALVLSKLRSAIGLNVPKLAISAAAPLSGEVLRFFNGIGIPLSDAWGMSELSGVVTMSAKGQVRPGTVGKPLDSVQIRIADDGEILVRGPMVMKGYLNKPDQTAETIGTDGWVHTGDIGEIDGDGYLSIVDRKKDLIINASGKNMSPSNIENWIKAYSPLIGQAVAIGNDRKYNVALISLDSDAVVAVSHRYALPIDPTELASHPAVYQSISDAVSQANTKLSRVEQIKKFRIVPDFWEPGSEVLTPTLKVRRKAVDLRYAELINELYAE